jgi:ligand-binding sensor domain-containing protein
LKYLFTYLLILVGGLCSAFAQELPEKGVPELRAYTPPEYNNQGKIWDIDSAPNGIVYMAANKGLVEYDGKVWRNYKGSAGFTRSIYVESDSLIYTGSDLDFGVWEMNEYREFEYTSLYPFREELAEIAEEFWEIYPMGESVLFVSETNIYVYRNNSLTKISAPEQFSGSYLLNGVLYFADVNNVLYRLTDLSLEFVTELPEITGFEITGLYSHEDGMVLVSYNSGLYLYSSGELVPLDNELSRNLDSASVFSFEEIDDSYYAFGTVQNGLFISDSDGNILHRVNRKKGLINNTVLSLHYSNNGQLWLGLDYGVSSLLLTGNLTYYYDYSGDFGTGYAALLSNEEFYLGTNKGLYQSDWEELNNDSDSFNLDLIPGSDGQVWTLKNIGDELLMGHDRGLFLIDGGNLERLSNERGFWTIIPFRNVLLGGTYNGIYVFEKTEGSWTLLKQLEFIAGSANQLIAESDRIVWVNIPNYGIIRVVLDENLYPVERETFFSETFKGEDPYLLKSDDEIQVYTDQLVYSYSPAENRFQETGSIPYKFNPEDALPGTFRPQTLNSEYEFLPVYNGFALRSLTRNQNSTDEIGPLLFRNTEVYNNTDRMSLVPDEPVPYRLNNLNVEYLIPNRRGVLYQYRLDESGDWSEWSAQTELNLVNLNPGNHELSVRAKDSDGGRTEMAILRFRITAPWYLSLYAYFGYALLLLTIGYFMFMRKSKALAEQQEKLKENQRKSLRKQGEEHKREMLLLEQKRLQEKNDQLENQLKNKTIELANKAKETQDKDSLLPRLKEKLEAAQKKPELTSGFWNEMYRLLDSNINQDDNTFEMQMDELHQEFFQKLRTKFPDLTTNDLRLCVYLKLGFSSKEIADFSNIKPSSVYINRSRLRKKLGLDSEQDLGDFLNKI